MTVSKNEGSIEKSNHKLAIMDDDNPLVSVGMLVYNAAATVEQSIKSLLNQDYKNFEIIICDNDSIDGSSQICESYANAYPVIKYYKNPSNIGAARNSLKSLYLAKGKYYMWASDHDLWDQRFISTAVTCLQNNPGLVLIYGITQLIDREGNALGLMSDRLDTQGLEVKQRFLKTIWNLTYCNAIYGVYRLDTLLKCNISDYSFCIGPDNVLLAELSLHGEIKQLESVLYHRRKNREDENFENKIARLKKYLLSSNYDWLDYPYLTFAFKHIGLVRNSDLNETVKCELIEAIVQWMRKRYSNQIDHEITVLLERFNKAREGVLLDNIEVSFLSNYLTQASIFSDRFPKLLSWVKDIDYDLLDMTDMCFYSTKDLDKNSITELKPLPDRPLVSIIMPTCNRPTLLPEAIESVVAQNYENWELIVVNEGNIDVEAIILKFNKRNNITYIKHRRSFGSSSARNSALRIARGDIVCYLDDDDVMYPMHLSTIVKGMQDSHYAVVYTDAVLDYQVIENGQRIKKQSNPYKHGDFSKDRLCVANYLPINTFAHRWECLEKSGLFDEKLTSLVDWDLLVRLARWYDFFHIHETTVEVRVRSDGDRITERDRHKSVVNHKIIYQKSADMVSHAVALQRRDYLKKLEQRYSNKSSDSLQTQKNTDYSLTWQKKHVMTDADKTILVDSLQAIRDFPNFLLLTVIETNEESILLSKTLGSLSAQLYQQWALIVLASMPKPDSLPDMQDQMHWLQVDGELYIAVNQVLSNVDGFDWVAVIQPGTLLTDGALALLTRYINLKPQWCFIYADEALSGDIDKSPQLLFKPEFNLDLLRSTPYIGNLCWIKKAVLDEFSGYCGLAGVLNWDLAFKVFERLGSSAFGHIPELISYAFSRQVTEAEQQYFAAAGKLILQRHFERLGLTVGVFDGLVPESFFIDYPLPQNVLVSIVMTVINTDQLARLVECINSIIVNTDYTHFQIVITSVFSETDITEALRQLDNNSVAIIYKSYQGHTVSPLTNQVAWELGGHYLLFFSPDLVVSHKNWLELMLAQANRQEIGIVSPRIIDGSGKLHHAGMILGMGDFGVADYVNRNLPMDQPGYMNRAAVVQNFSAVSSLCLLVKTSLMTNAASLNGSVFDHIHFCLRVARQGLSIVWTPYVTLILQQQTLQKRTMDELRGDADLMIEQWLPELANDPAFNRNLSLKHRHFQVETETDVTWNVDFHDRLRVCAFPANESGVGEYRVRSPLRALTKARMIQSSLLPNHNETLIPDIVEIARVKPDVVLLQNAFADYLINAWQQYRKFNDVFLVYAQDDLVYSLPHKHPLHDKWPKDIKKRIYKILSQSDRLIVATEPLREAFGQKIADVRLVPNYLETARWTDLEFIKITSTKPRVGWAGGGQHQGDLEFILPVIEATRDEVDWIFFGMCPDSIRPYIYEFHAGVKFDQYPQKLASLNLDLAVAPLEHNNFNMAKTNLRLLEYGILGWPVLCTDIFPYQNAPVTRVPNIPHIWIKKIREMVHDLPALKKEGLLLQQWVRANYLLEEHLDEWLSALTP